MVIKNIVYLFLILCPFRVYSQCNQQELNSRIKNDSVKFEILKAGVANVKDFKLIPSQVKIEVTCPRITFAGQCDTGLLIRSLVPLLSNKNSDWCAILLLYSMSGKDASRLIGVNKNQWRRYYKNNDVEYWQNYLMKNKN